MKDALGGAIELMDLRHAYDGHEVVRGLDLSVKPGEIFGLLGPNGAGKSTTLRILAGLLRPSGGRVKVAGCDVVAEPLAAKSRLGFVPEDASVYEVLTGIEYLRMVMELRALEPTIGNERIDHWISYFGLGEVRHTRLSAYSKGMRQKLLVAAALLHEPRVLLLDEPLNGLDPRAARQLKDLLLELAGKGTAVVYSSHVLDVVERLCSHIGILHRGAFQAVGRPAELVEAARVASLEALFLDLTAQ